MADYGNTNEPGILTNYSSKPTVATAAGAPTTPVLIGQADLTNGTASADEVKQVPNSTKAREYFGDSGGLLTDAIQDCIAAGASTVYAVAPSSTDVTGEDLSGLSSNTGTLANAPVIEDASSVTFTINGSALTTVIEYVSQSNMSPGSGEVSLNPVNAEFKIDSGTAVGNAGDDVNYTYFDYSGAHDAVTNDKAARTEGDFFVPLNENSTVKTDAQTTVNELDNDYFLMLMICGAGTPHIADISNYSNSFDDKRVLNVYPTRNADGSSVLGSYAGVRARLGIDATPINHRLDAHKDLLVSLTESKRGTLNSNNTVALAEESQGARINDDVNTVSSSNSQDANIQFGFATLVVDNVIETLRLNERPFIGRLHNQAVRNTLEDLMKSQLKSYLQSRAITNYTVNINKVDGDEAELEIGINVTEPLRFIHNEVAITG